ncbi:macro domain-containing protein [Plesiomonas shigelloides]|uniref:type II toxin-antitoxin system antitoxin DNA ADP-ribosyl glycohydrolase DarG n=1 Tax=Plesiomonas shigelloides TaxID=703 RepID=UPI0022455A96|nr:macro domain-containing protein [Plesiomonas shigelloides]MCX2533360.1 macro domain-containing protein [Plesiomonas shigelloides]
MIQYVTGNILHDQADAVVNTVNTVGVMGKGLALQFKKAYPNNFSAYKKACDTHALTTGQVLAVSVNALSAPYYVINFPTKSHWKANSKMEFIESGLVALKKEVARLGLKSVAIPALGSGLGGLPWDKVKHVIEQSLSDVPEIDWRIYPPQDAPPASAMINKTKKPKMTQGRAAVLGLIHQYLSTGFGYRLSLLEVQKLVYFLTAAGEPLNQVVFQKHYYGPYADVLRHVLEKMEGHFISGYADGINKPQTPIELKAEAAAESLAFLEHHPETKQRFESVSKLIEGFESQNGMELLSTVHWVVTQELPSSDWTEEDIIHRIHQWSPHKARMKPAHIIAAYHRLQRDNWLEKKAPSMR